MLPLLLVYFLLENFIKVAGKKSIFLFCSDEIFEIIQNLKDQDLSILLVEQNAAKALKIADHFYLLDQGNVAFSGSPAEVESDDILKKAYLGSDAA